MGIFSSDEEVVVQSQAMKLMDKTPDLIPNSIKTSLLSVDGDIVPDLINNCLNGLAPRVSQAYRYARDKYVYGLPEGSVVAFNANDASVVSILKKITGKNIYINTNVTDNPKPSFWAKEFMQENRGWDSATNIVASPPVPYRGSRVVYFGYASSRKNNEVTINYYYEEGNEKKYFNETVPTISPLDKSKNYVHVIYQIKEIETILPTFLYWFYEIGSGIYPELDILQGESIGSPFMPIVPIRLWGVNQAEDKNTEFFKTAKFTLDKLAMNFGQIAEQVHENKDIHQIDHCYIVFACHIADKSMSVKRYIHQYFRYLHSQAKFSEDDFQNWENGNSFNKLPSYTSIHLSDANLSWSINYLWSSSEIKEGKVGKGAIGHVEVEHKYSGRKGDGFSYFPTDVVTSTRQITKTHVEVFKVGGLNFYSHVHKGEGVSFTAAHAFSDMDGGCFLLPYDVNVAKQLSMYHRHDLIQDSIYLVLNSYDEIEIKWYQQGIFKVVFTIVMAVFAFYTGQWQAFFASLGTTVVSVAIALIQKLALAIIINVGLTAIAKNVSPELAMLISVATVITGSIIDLPFSMTAIDAAQMGIQLTNTSISFASEDLMSDYGELGEYWGGMFDELEELQKEMYEPEFDGMRLVSEYYKHLEIPETWDQYYRRVINIPNNGYSVLQSIEQYVEQKTSLPTFNESMTTLQEGK